jgi:hypothetical protein
MIQGHLQVHFYNCIQQLARINKECYKIKNHFKFGFIQQNDIFCSFE